METQLKLPSMEHTFNIRIVGADTGTVFEGDFTYKRPNLKKKSEISKMATRLNGDLSTVPDDVSFFNQIRSFLNFCISNAPDWWVKSDNGGDLYDINVLDEIYKKCVEFESEWNKKVWPSSDEAKTNVDEAKKDN